MAPHSNWNGYLRLSLVSVPIKAYSATAASEGKIRLHQLHDECHSRIRYRKVCPIHGEVSNAEIVSGYEYSKGHYVVVDEQELDALDGAGERAIHIDRFVPECEIDPTYFDGRNYFLLPNGPSGAKPYALLAKAMEDEGRTAIVEGVITAHDQIGIVRSVAGLLILSQLKFESQIRGRETVDDEVPELKGSAKELELAKDLIRRTTEKHPDLSKYHDTYTERLTEAIQAKVAGKEIVAPAREEAPVVINLMDALKKSVARANPKASKRTSRKAAPRKVRTPRAPATKTQMSVARRIRKSS